MNANLKTKFAFVAAALEKVESASIVIQSWIDEHKYDVRVGFLITQIQRLHLHVMRLLHRLGTKLETMHTGNIPETVAPELSDEMLSSLTKKN